MKGAGTTRPTALEARLVGAMDMAGLGLFDFDLATRSFVFSEQAARIYGFQATSMTWHEWALGVHPEDLDEVTRCLTRPVRDATDDLWLVFRFRSGDGDWRWISKRGRPARDAPGTLTSVAGIVTDVTESRLADARQSALLESAQHRVKSVVAVVRSIAARTAESAGDLETFSALFQGRLEAFARTHSALARTAADTIALEALIEDEFRVHAGTEAETVVLTGDTVSLDGRTAELLGLVFHELANNAVRHGALSANGGKVAVAWTRTESPCVLSLEWRETWPWTATPPDRFGFGRELIERALPYQLDAETSLTFASNGMTCVIAVPLPNGGTCS